MSRRPSRPAAAARRPGRARRVMGQDTAKAPLVRRRYPAVPTKEREPAATVPTKGQEPAATVPTKEREPAAAVPQARQPQAPLLHTPAPRTRRLAGGIAAGGQSAGTGIPPGRLPARWTVPDGGTARCRLAAIQCRSSGRSLRRTSRSGEYRSSGRPAPRPARPSPPSLPRREEATHPQLRRQAPWTASPTRWMSAGPGTSGRSAARRPHRNRRPTTSGRPGIPPSLCMLLPDPDSLRRPRVQLHLVPVIHLLLQPHRARRLVDDVHHLGEQLGGIAVTGLLGEGDSPP
jgi:hypothetical protein